MVGIFDIVGCWNYSSDLVSNYILQLMSKKHSQADKKHILYSHLNMFLLYKKCIYFLKQNQYSMINNWAYIKNIICILHNYLIKNHFCKINNNSRNNMFNIERRILSITYLLGKSPQYKRSNHSQSKQSTKDHKNYKQSLLLNNKMANTKDKRQLNYKFGKNPFRIFNIPRYFDYKISQPHSISFTYNLQLSCIMSSLLDRLNIIIITHRDMPHQYINYKFHFNRIISNTINKINTLHSKNQDKILFNK